MAWIASRASRRRHASMDASVTPRAGRREVLITARSPPYSREPPARRLAERTGRERERRGRDVEHLVVGEGPDRRDLLQELHRVEPAVVRLGVAAGWADRPACSVPRPNARYSVGREERHVGGVDLVERDDADHFFFPPRFAAGFASGLLRRAFAGFSAPSSRPASWRPASSRLLGLLLGGLRGGGRLRLALLLLRRRVRPAAPSVASRLVFGAGGGGASSSVAVLLGAPSPSASPSRPRLGGFAALGAGSPSRRHATSGRPRAPPRRDRCRDRRGRGPPSPRSSMLSSSAAAGRRRFGREGRSTGFGRRLQVELDARRRHQRVVDVVLGEARAERRARRRPRGRAGGARCRTARAPSPGAGGCGRASGAPSRPRRRRALRRR